MTQSEWAAWTQAALTCITFVVALVKQSRTDNRAAKQKATSDAQLMEEKVRAADERRAYAESLLAKEKAEALLKARATAIFIRPELLNFEAALETIVNSGPADSLAELFDLLLPNLAIRNRSLEALQIPAATEVLLNVTDRAHVLHNYLHACSEAQAYGSDEHNFIADLAKNALPKVQEAHAAVEVIAEGRHSPQL
ncbi:hypothetical protein [Stenotrophomonas forensis]|uniref:hypothetical protein n=1 Tax=Stenotrophomonas forensis TaxID=2871169 RepID=UPI0039C684E8